MYIELKDRNIELDPDEMYYLFNKEVDASTVQKCDFSYLSEIDTIVLQSLLSRSSTIPMRLHPDIVESIKEESQNSPYFNKDNYEIESIYKKESTRDISKVKEQNKMKAPVDLTDQGIRTKRTRSINNLVNMGYDRSFAMDTLRNMIDRDGAGILNLPPSRISALVDEEIQKQID